MANATFRQLQVLMTVVGKGSFSAAADALYISQTSVSKQIAALERNLGYSVFQRSPGAVVQLTPQGSQLVTRLPELLRQAQMLEPQQPRPEPVRKVRVACGDMIADTINEHLWSFYAEHQNIEIQVVLIDPNPAAIQDMESQHFDLLYITNKQLPSGSTVRLLKTFDSGIYAAANKPQLVNWSPVSGVSLPVIFFLSNSYLSRSIERTLTGSGITAYQVVAHVPNFETMLKLALQGVGAICALESVVEPYLRNGQLQPLAVQTGRTYRFGVRNDRMQGVAAVDAVDQFISRLLTEY